MIFNRTAAVMRNQKAMFKIQQMYFFTYFLSIFFVINMYTCILFFICFLSPFATRSEGYFSCDLHTSTLRVMNIDMLFLLTMLCSKGRFISIRKVCWNFKNNGNVCEDFLITYITVITVIENHIRTNIIFNFFFFKR